MAPQNNSDIFLENLEKSIEQLPSLSLKEMKVLSQNLRKYIIEIVYKNGGHLSSNLGIVDLTLALYRCFRFPVDTLIFDVSHQAYAHKILSGRLRKFQTIRTSGGLSGFTDPKESPFDIVHVAHAGTAISTGMAMASVKRKRKDASYTIAVVGDSAMANGTSFEALNSIRDKKIHRYIVILNDNQMSISATVGGFSRFLTNMISHPLYHQSKKKAKKILRIFGRFPNKLVNLFLMRLRLLIYNNYFDSFGIRYIGPIDGHDLKGMERLFQNITNERYPSDQPLLIHILTLKGKGSENSELYPEATHGISPAGVLGHQEEVPKRKTYTQIFGETLIQLQEKYKNIAATTAAMSKGTGLEGFSKKYPNQFFDVGIAESHAVVFSSFLSYKSTYKPYIAIYSTFLQRAMDQIFQDVCLQSLTPVFILDRAGFVGEDGPTHHGIYDIAYLKSFPRLILASPISGRELEMFLDWSYHQDCAVAIRFPKASQYDDSTMNLPPIEKGKGVWIRQHEKAVGTLLVYGPIFEEVLNLEMELPPLNVLNLRFAKPLDTEFIQEALSKNLPVLIIEEHAALGGVGESIQAFACEIGVKQKISSIAIPDYFVEHKSRREQLEEVGLSGQPLKKRILSALERE